MVFFAFLLDLHNFRRVFSTLNKTAKKRTPPLQGSRFQTLFPEKQTFTKSNKKEHPNWNALDVLLFEKSVNDVFFGFCFGKSQSHQFDELLTCDFADGCLVNK